MPMKYRELSKMLRGLGCKIVRHDKTSHVLWESPTGKRFPVKSHGSSTEFSDFMIRNFLRQGGLKK